MQTLRAMQLTLCLLLASCNPFQSLTTEIDKVVPESEVAEITLLDEDRRLPPSARNVHLYFLQFQDPVLRIRFDVPLKDAKKFAEEQTGQKLKPGCPIGFFNDDAPKWWLKSCQKDALSASQTKSADPPVRKYLVVPKGSEATVWLETFSD
jgi:hypothetical protein